MKVLGIESSGRHGGVALVEEGIILGSVDLSGRATQGQRVMPAVEWMLARLGLSVADLGGVGVSIGPGSFTGLRVGVASAKALAWARGIPLAAVPTLRALALRPAFGAPDRLILPLLDARNGAVHGGFFRGTGLGVPEELAPSVSEPLEDVARQALILLESHNLSGISPVGEGWVRHRDSLAQLLSPYYFPVPAWMAQATAQTVALLAEEQIRGGLISDLDTLEPTYQSKGTPAW